MTKKIHIAIATHHIEASIVDYSARLNAQPCVVIAGEYALWRTDNINLSVRKDLQCQPGAIRHLGWEDPEAQEFSQQTDINGIVWERFTAQDQAKEIHNLWPKTAYQP